MPPKLGIVALTLGILAVASVANATEALIDKGPGLDDLPKVMDASAALYGLKDFSLEQAKAEVKDLDATEQEALGKLFADKFDIKADSLELLIEKGMEILFSAIPFLIMVLDKIKAKQLALKGA